MKEKTFRKVYFSVSIIVLVLVSFVVYYHFEQKKYLENTIDSSYQEFINDTKQKIASQYKNEYELSEEEFEIYWEDYENSDEFKIMEVKYKEELRERLENDGFNLELIQLYFLKFVLVLIPTTPISLIFEGITLIGVYFLLKWIYPLFVPENILKKKERNP